MNTETVVSQLEGFISELNQTENSSTYLTLTIKGKLPPGAQAHAVPIRVTFSRPLPSVPTCAWLANFEGGDFAEAIWTVQNVTQNGFILWGMNVSNRILSPNFLVKFMVAF